MSNDYSNFKVDSLKVGGVGWAIEDGSATIEGAARVTTSVVPSSDGPDFTKRSRVPTSINARIQFGPGIVPSDLAGMSGIQIVLQDKAAPRRCVANNCVFASMGRIGDGPVDVSFHVLEPLQWL
jgi:hypothetical protein